MNIAMRSSSISSQSMENSIRLGAHVLVLISGLALFLTEKLPMSSALLVSGALAAWILGRKPARGKFWEIASFLYLLFFFFDLFRISRGLAPALVHLFLFILINKLFNLQSARDYYQLFLLTFLTILAASSLSVEIGMFYVITFYIVLLIWNLISVTLFFEWKAQGSSGIFPFSVFSPKYMLLILTTGILTFVVAMGIFFVIPRMQLGFFNKLRSGKTQHVSGFSQKVNLGDIAQIDENQDVAMRVRVSGNPELFPRSFYWRGIAFDHYDGKSWSTSSFGTRFLNEGSDGFFYTASGNASNDQMIRQEFYMEPLDTRVLFGVDRIVKVRGNFGGITRDNNWTLTGMNRTESYEVYSRPGPHQRTQSTSSEIPEYMTRYYLQLPFRNPEVEGLANEIVAARTAPAERVTAVRNYLQRNFRYTTMDLPINDADPVSVFLFQKKAGHCEYFATSMVLMLRYLGIPARIVNGFLEGEYNEIGDFYLVRQSDAHSWVEAYLDGAWVSFDPSPLPDNSAGPFHFLLNWRMILESIQFFWDRYVLIFSAQDQVDAVSSVRDEYRRVNAKLKETYQSPEFGLFLQRFWERYRLFLAIAFVAVLAGFQLFRFYWKYRQRQQINSTPLLFYQEMLSILERKGYSRTLSSTPAEFVKTITNTLPEVAKPDVIHLTDLFYRARFGKYPLSKVESSEIEASLKRLHQI